MQLFDLSSGSINILHPHLMSTSRLLSQDRVNYGSLHRVRQHASSISRLSDLATISGTGLQRGLSPRQVQMIAVAGTIGTGLFLGTGRSLAEGGPASMLICYGTVSFIVYITLLLLGEMATQYPVAGSFNAYATRFLSPSYGFALAWNYWFNDAVSVASDLIAAQLVLHFWGIKNAWIVSLVFWIFLVGVNAISVGGYGELGTVFNSLGSSLLVSKPSGRILVVVVEGRHCYPLHNCWDGCQCRIQYRTQGDWLGELEDTWCPFRWGVRRVCQGICYC